MSGRLKTQIAIHRPVLHRPVKNTSHIRLVQSRNTPNFSVSAFLSSPELRRSQVPVAGTMHWTAPLISGDMTLEWKLVGSQVAAGLRSHFRQKGPTSERTFH